MTRVNLLCGMAGRTYDGAELRLRLPWYRSLPLSSIDVELTLDGETVDAGRMRFHINDRDYELDALADHETEFWFVLDTARLRVSDVPPGTHDVELRLDLRIPYLFDEETGDVLVTRHQVAITVAVPDEATA